MADLTLYLLRHGESEGNVARIFDSRKLNPPLTEEGQRQAERMARLLKDLEFSAAYSSPLVRARMTAEAVCRPHGLTPVLTDHLLEVGVGPLDGASQDDPDTMAAFTSVAARWEDGSPDAAFPGGESLEDVHGRFGSLLDSLDGAGHGPVLVVGHSLLFAAVIWCLCENRPAGFNDGFMGRGCLSVVARQGEGFRLVGFNISPDTPPGGVHLA